MTAVTLTMQFDSPEAAASFLSGRSITEVPKAVVTPDANFEKATQEAVPAKAEAPTPKPAAKAKKAAATPVTAEPASSLPSAEPESTEPDIALEVEKTGGETSVPTYEQLVNALKAYAGTVDRSVFVAMLKGVGVASVPEFKTQPELISKLLAANPAVAKLIK